MQNPDKFIRKAYLTLLTPIGLPIWDMQIPADVTVPSKYYLLQTQTKREKDRNKCDKLWDCTLSIDIYVRGTRGFADRSVIDDMEQAVTDLVQPDVQSDIAIPPFVVYETIIEQPIDVNIQTPNETILHRVLRIRHFVGEAAV